MKDYLLAILVLLICLSEALLLGFELSYLGFPDGHLTDLDLALQYLLPVAIGILVGYSCYLLFTVIKRRAALPRKNLITGFFVIHIVLFACYLVLLNLLSSGQGG